MTVHRGRIAMKPILLLFFPRPISRPLRSRSTYVSRAIIIPGFDMLMRRPVADFYVNVPVCSPSPRVFRRYSPFRSSSTFSRTAAPVFRGFPPRKIFRAGVKSCFTCRLISNGIVHTRFSVQLARKKGLSVSIVGSRFMV